MKLVSIITVNFNHFHLTEALIRSVFSVNTYPSIEVIVVDNGSTEDPTPAWKERYPEVKFIRSERTLGFAGGNNLGIREATGDYLFLVNNDTEFTATLVEELVGTLDKDEKVGVVSPKIRYFEQPEILQYAGYTPMNYLTCRNACIGQFQKDVGQYDTDIQETGYAHGAAMMVRGSAIDKAGLMAENYFLYYEELDWCERIRRAGYSIVVNPKAIIYHKESMSVGKNTLLKEYFMNRNRILFVRRNSTPAEQLIFYCYFLGVVAPRNILHYVKGKQYDFCKVFLKAVWWNFTNSKNSKKLGYSIN